MQKSLDQYLKTSKKNLLNIILFLEKNIEYTKNNLWTSNEEFDFLLRNIIDIYYERYYFYPSNDFSKIDKYIKFNNNINRRLKLILISIIDYYENNKERQFIIEKEESILYLNILIYIGIIITEKDFNNLNTPKKIEKTINNILDNFANIRFRKDRDLEKLIQDIKPIVLLENKVKDSLLNLVNPNSYNYYININKDKKYYKVFYQYNIEDLDKFDSKDVINVMKKLNIKDAFRNISRDLSYVTLFKCLKNGINIILLFPIDKKDNISEMKNNIINEHIKYLVDYNEIKDDFEYINKLKENNIDIYIEVSQTFETNNYNMFMGIKNIVVTEEFLNTNEKYLEIWKDMNINFIVKNFENKITENELLKEKEVKYE